MCSTRRGRTIARETSFEEFWSRERDQLFRALLMTLADQPLAAEAVDEAMVRAFARWDRVSRLEHPAGWVYRVGLNWAISQRRKLSLRPTRRTEDLDRAIHDRLPDVDLARSLMNLNPKHRAALVMRHYLQLMPREIAQVLDLPEGTVKSRLSRAAEQLRSASKVTP